MYFGRATLSNVTIDDTVPTFNHEIVAYDPPSAWNSKGFCPHGPCSISPDINRIESGTWHESTFHAGPNHANDFPNQPLSATARFRGSAVHVYAVLPPATGSKAPSAAITFHIDGILVNEFSHASGPDYVYDFLVYENSSLPFDSHEITIVNGKPDGVPSLFILDRIVYSTVSNGNPISPSFSVDTEEPVSTASIRGPSPTSSDQASLSSSLGGSISTPFLRDPNITTSYNTMPTTPLTQNPTAPPDTLSDGSTASGHPLSLGAIAGIVLGSLTGIIAFFLIILYRRRRRQRRDSLRKAYPEDLMIRAGSPRTYPSFQPREGWTIASDSKRDVLVAASHPPAYRS